MIADEPADISGNGAYNGEGRDRGFGAQVKHYARDAVHAAQDFSHYVRSHDLETIRTDVEGRVREHPIAAVAIGFGIGFLFGKLFR